MFANLSLPPTRHTPTRQTFLHSSSHSSPRSHHIIDFERYLQILVTFGGWGRTAPPPPAAPRPQPLASPPRSLPPILTTMCSVMASWMWPQCNCSMFWLKPTSCTEENSFWDCLFFCVCWFLDNTRLISQVVFFGHGYQLSMHHYGGGLRPSPGGGGGGGVPSAAPIVVESIMVDGKIVPMPNESMLNWLLIKQFSGLWLGIVLV